MAGIVTDFMHSVQSLSRVRLFAAPWTAAHQASLSFTIFQTLLKLMSIESAMPSDYLILCHLFFSCPQFSPASGCFPMSWLFASGGQSIRASASVLLLNVQGWFPLRLTGLIFLLSKWLSMSSPAPKLESIKSSVFYLCYCPALISVHDYWKNHSFWLYRHLSAK